MAQEHPAPCGCLDDHGSVANGSFFWLRGAKPGAVGAQGSVGDVMKKAGGEKGKMASGGGLTQVSPAGRW